MLQWSKVNAFATYYVQQLFLLVPYILCIDLRFLELCNHVAALVCWTSRRIFFFYCAFVKYDACSSPICVDLEYLSMPTEHSIGSHVSVRKPVLIFLFTWTNCAVWNHLTWPQGQKVAFGQSWLSFGQGPYCT